MLPLFDGFFCGFCALRMSCDQGMRSAHPLMREDVFLSASYGVPCPLRVSTASRHAPVERIEINKLATVATTAGYSRSRASHGYIIGRLPGWVCGCKEGEIRPSKQ